MSPQHGHVRNISTSCSSTTSATDGTTLTPSPLVSPASANTSSCTNLAQTNSNQQAANGPLESTDANRPKGGCTVQFERRFIEVDDELVSVITDIEGEVIVFPLVCGVRDFSVNT